MCRAASAAAVGAVLLALGSPPPIAAQDGPGSPSDPVQAQLAKLDSLVAIREQMVRARDSLSEEIRVRDSLRWARVEILDTIRVGPFRLVGREGALGRAEPLVGSAWRGEAPLLGEEGEARLRETVFVVTAPGAGIPGAITSELRRRPGHQEVRLPGRRHPLRAQRVVSRALAVAVLETLPAELEGWVVLGRTGADPPSSIERRRAVLDWAAAAANRDEALRRTYRELALATAPVARRCFEGSVRACRLALGLDDPGPRWEGWYGIEELRRIAAAELAEGRARRRASHAHACVHELDDDRCLEHFLRSGGPPAPVGVQVRTTFLREVLRDAGGEGVEGLFREAEGETAAARVERAAPGSLDGAVERWRNRVEAHAPPAPDPPLRARLSTLFWLVVLAGLAMRSTRWRVG